MLTKHEINANPNSSVWNLNKEPKCILTELLDYVSLDKVWQQLKAS